MAFLWSASACAQTVDPPTKRADQHFAIDPVSDIVLTGGGAGVTALLSLILSTGEIKAPPLAPGDENRLLSIDRVAVTQTIDPNAGLYSDVGSRPCGLALVQRPGAVPA